MSINTCSFTYDGFNCIEDYDVFICWIATTQPNTSNGSKIEKITHYSPTSKQWKTSGFKYTEPLSFNFHIAKIDNTYLTADEIQKLQRWLKRMDEDKELKFNQQGYEDIVFFGTFIESNIISSGGNNIGLDLTFQTNAPFGFSSLKTYMQDPDGLIVVHDGSSEIGEICVNLNIYCNSDTDVIIKNSFNKNEMVINNCKAGEEIEIDGNTKIITTSLSSHKIYDDFNFCYLKVGNGDDNENTITIIGDVTVTLSYREIRKVGI